MTPVHARDAATVVLLRDTGDSERGERFEVLMLKRTSGASFLANAHVFPGGVVDDEDDQHEIGGPWPGTRFVVAAIRECFEEAGVLLAVDRDGRHVDGQRRAMWRGELARGERTFRDLVRVENLVLDSHAVQYWSRWVTPVGSPKRFDARFFVARAPASHDATPDFREITESVWITPARALKMSEKGEMTLILPTSKTLHALMNAGSIDAVFRQFAAS